MAESGTIHNKLQSLYEQVAQLQRANKVLQTQLERYSLEMTDLETILDVTIKHGDAIETQLFCDVEEARRKAGIDELTQLANRRKFNEYFEQVWRQMMRDGTPLSLVFCDVDYFKNYNDNYGHLAGDRCLRLVADAIVQAIRRPFDLASRYGGEEFAIILPNTHADGASQVARQIQSEVLQFRIPHQRSSVSDWVTLSIGVASTIPERTAVPDSLIDTADRALYEAKAQGRNRVVISVL